MSMCKDGSVLVYMSVWLYIGECVLYECINLCENVCEQVCIYECIKVCEYVCIWMGECVFGYMGVCTVCV